MRVQFTVNDIQESKLRRLAYENGYPDVPSYCKDICLQERTYVAMWETITEKIAEMKPGTLFALRDLIPSPPANLGVKLYQNQKKLGIEVRPQKDSLHSNCFIKL